MCVRIQYLRHPCKKIKAEDFPERVGTIPCNTLRQCSSLSRKSTRFVAVLCPSMSIKTWPYGFRCLLLEVWACKELNRIEVSWPNDQKPFSGFSEILFQDEDLKANNVYDTYCSLIKMSLNLYQISQKRSICRFRLNLWQPTSLEGLLYVLEKFRVELLGIIWSS